MDIDRVALSLIKLGGWERFNSDISDGDFRDIRPGTPPTKGFSTGGFSTRGFAEDIPHVPEYSWKNFFTSFVPEELRDLPWTPKARVMYGLGIGIGAATGVGLTKALGIYPFGKKKKVVEDEKKEVVKVSALLGKAMKMTPNPLSNTLNKSSLKSTLQPVSSRLVTKSKGLVKNQSSRLSRLVDHRIM